MRKIAPAAFLLTGILVFGGLFLASPAQADDDDQTSTSESGSTPVPGVPGEHGEKHSKRHELEKKYGKEGRLALPPLVIRPKRDTDEVANQTEEEYEESEQDESSETVSSSKVSSSKVPSGAGSSGSSASNNVSGAEQAVGSASAGFIAINPAAKGSAVALTTGTLVDPKQNTAIDIANVKFSKKTPADVFIQAAQVGLYAMAAGAVALSLLAASRAIRRK